MEPKPAYAQRDSLAFLDVREHYEWRTGHIEGSIHIPLKTLPDRFREIATGKRVMVVCEIGQRSDLAARFLRGHGFDAHNLDGGLVHWHMGGLPLMRPDASSGRPTKGRGRILEG
jgi:rhodanese-related sulfurtransferase